MSAPSIVCPVCHTQQPNAWDCVVCGGSLHDKPKHWQVPVAPLEGLETTALPDTGNLALDRLEGLEITSHTEAPPPALGGRLEGLEPTGFETTAFEGPGETLEALEPTSHGVEALPSPLLPVTCRYCGTPWREGSIFCRGCGVRVTTLQKAPEGAEPATVTCSHCGTLGQVPGRPCIGCGHGVR